MRFQGLTGRSLAALKNYQTLCRLDVVVDDLDDHYDRLLVKAIFTLTHLQELKLDTGPLGEHKLSDFDWALLTELQVLELKVAYKAPQSCYDCLLKLPKLNDLTIHYGHPTPQTLEALTQLSRLFVYMPPQTAADASFMTALQSLTALYFLALDGQPTESAVQSLTALVNLQVLQYWPDRHRCEETVSSCPATAASSLCQLSKLILLECAVVHEGQSLCANLDVGDAIPPVTPPDSPIAIYFR